MKVINHIKLFTCILCCISLTTKAQHTRKKEFQIFDAIHYKNKPDLSAYGLKKIDLVYEAFLTQPDTANPNIKIIDTTKVIKRAKQALLNPHIPVSLDIESWWSIRDTAEVTRRYKQTVDIFRRHNTASPLGFYGIGPLNLNLSRWRNNNNYEKAYKGWMYYNNLLTPSRQFTNILFPSFYIMNNTDMKTCIKDIEFCMKDARKSNKKVYAYIWPQYYDAPQNPYFKKFIDAQTWYILLETCYKLCDGIVIWTSNKDENNQLITWGDARMMLFWNATLAFMKKHHLK